MQFTVQFDLANSPSLNQLSASEQADVLLLVNAAAESWSHHLASNHNLSIGIRVDASAYSGQTLAEGFAGDYRSNTNMDDFVTVYWGSAEAHLKTGVGTSPTTDIILNLTPDAVKNLLFFRQDPFGPPINIPAGKTDALAVFQHELGHALGIYSFSESRSDATFGTRRTIFDSFVELDVNGNPIFTGANARAVAGVSDGVRLENTSIGHLLESGSYGSDLMSAQVNSADGISQMDLAILKDIGVDIREATSGNDEMYALNGGYLYLGAGNDVGHAVPGAYGVWGEGGQDYLIGSWDNDTMSGGNGHDLLEGHAGSDFLRGGDGNDFLDGGSGGDYLDGGTGDDEIRGGSGNDTYVIDSLGDVVVEDNSDDTDDTVYANGIDYVLSANLERLYLGGTMRLVGVGNSSNNSFAGNEGGSTLYGGAGDDSYSTVNDGSDFIIVENPNEGHDRVFAQFDYALSDNIEDLYLYSGDWTGQGNGLSNWIDAHGGNNYLVGKGGNDTLDGGEGTDVARYSGLASDYRISKHSGTYSEITDLRPGSPDGTDILRNMEKLQWSDSSITDMYFLPFANNAVVPGANGKADILIQHGSGHVALWRMSGNASISSGMLSPTTPDWKVKEKADFNGDGKSDILWQNDDGRAAIWMMDGSTMLASGSGSLAVSAGSWRIRTAGDFNGDGKADIAWQNGAGQSVIWLMNGTGIVANTGPLDTSSGGWQVVSSGDFNGDGKADLLWQSPTGQAAIWLMNGTAMLPGSGGLTNVGPEWKVKDAADFNGDGKSDILWQNDNGQAAIWLMNGTAVQAGSGSLTPTTADWKIRTTGYYDSDVNADIVWQNIDGRTVNWLMSGTTLLSSGALGYHDADWHVAA